MTRFTLLLVFAVVALLFHLSACTENNKVEESSAIPVFADTFGLTTKAMTARDSILQEIRKYVVNYKYLKPVATDSLFETNTIGYCYLKSSKNDKYKMRIEFPDHIELQAVYWAIYDSLANLHEISIQLPPQTIVLFNEFGEIATLRGVTNCKIGGFCENDGGPNPRPVFEVEIDKKDLQSDFLIKQIDGLEFASFALVNVNLNAKAPRKMEAKLPEETILLTGKLNLWHWSGNTSLSNDSNHDISRYLMEARVSCLVDENDSCFVINSNTMPYSSALRCCGP